MLCLIKDYGHGISFLIYPYDPTYITVKKSRSLLLRYTAFVINSPYYVIVIFHLHDLVPDTKYIVAVSALRLIFSRRIKILLKLSVYGFYTQCAFFGCAEYLYIKAVTAYIARKLICYKPADCIHDSLGRVTSYKQEITAFLCQVYRLSFVNPVRIGDYI